MARRTTAASMSMSAPLRMNGVRAMSNHTIVYTDTDEAPYLATYSLLPIFQKFTSPFGIDMVKKDISVAGRILSLFPDNLTPDQRIEDELSKLGELCKTPVANVIKLPNVSASIPQLIEAIEELQGQGYDIPSYPSEPKTDEERAIAATYSKALGSSVNPVLREGNSDRRVAAPVKSYAQNNPHRLKKWSKESRAGVAHMEDGDFFSAEQSYVMPSAGNVKIEFVGKDGSVKVLKAETALQEGEVIDSSRMSVKALRAFFEKEISACHEKGLMISLHMKATMMKISDPVIFGHCVTVYFKDVFEKHGALFEELGVNPNNGFDSVLQKIKGHAKETEILADIDAVYASRPGLAMVDSAKGITNLHVPNDVIIDASMPNVVRDGGCMWNKDDALEEVMCMIPDRCYAGIYEEILNFCRENGEFDVSKMGNVANVGLMAQKAEEYGSHDKTFILEEAGTIRVVDDSGKQIFEHAVETGDIWRMAQTKDEPIQDWVKLAVSRMRATGSEGIFWLDEKRAHDANLIKKIEQYIVNHDTSGLNWSIMKPQDAMAKSCANAHAEKDTISITGNVLRDYLTDLFPILELGTSAKMLSIVPLLKGGGLYETGAGGSAPKHVQQFVKEGHLRWDSLGEYLATAVSLEDIGTNKGDAKALLLGNTLNEAIGELLDNRKSPSRKVNELDNRGSNFYVARYWSEALAKQTQDSEIAAHFAPLAQQLAENEDKIVKELVDCQGSPVDLGGYYKPDAAKATAAMCPSPTLNAIIGGQ